MEKKISINIPNFNGRDLLAENLPRIIKECTGCEIIVVDDASGDDSVEFIKENFKKIKLIQNLKNLGFAQSVNIGAKAASGKLVLLLNSDVVPRAGFLNYAADHFKNLEDKIFAVGLADYSHEGSNLKVRGRGGANFKRGFINHFALKPEAGHTFWVSGGSGLFDKNAFLSLGGFNTCYKPFYWEDIDLSYRAQKNGLICLFEPKAKVDHFHNKGAIKKLFKANYIKTVSYKNQFIFVWTNIEDYLLLCLHILWLPYNMAKAAISFDWPFFLGFFWAVFQIPELITHHQQIRGNSILSDRQVLKKYE